MANIWGNARANVLVGTSAPDQIFGFGGDDRLYGLLGADSLFGGPGNDLLDGGKGRDLLDGGKGDDTVTFAGTATPIVADLALGVAFEQYKPWASDHLVSIEGLIGGSGDDAISGSSSRNELHGGAGDDWIDGRVGHDRLFGDAGDDTIYGGNGSDTVDGGAGNDELYGDSGQWATWDARQLVRRDTVSFALDRAAVTVTLATTEAFAAFYEAGTATHAGSADVDTLYGFENVVGGLGADSITGNDDDNLLAGGRGNDTLNGGAGDDTLVGNAGTDTFDGGAGSDTVDYSENTNAVRLNLSRQVASFPGRNWDPEIFVSIENATTGSGNDTIFGDDGANVLDGGLGADRISGGGGSDTVSYVSHTAAVSVDLASGVGTIIGTRVRDTLIDIENATGGAGNDILRGSSADNVLDGGAGNDTVSGGAGNDEIHLTAGSDVIDGGAGSDTVVLDFGYEAYPGLIYSGEWDYVYDRDIITYDGDHDMDLLVDLARGTITTYEGPPVAGALTGIENVTTGAGNDFVVGSDGANVISVGHGANVVDAGRGNDLIYGSNDQTEWAAWSDYNYEAYFNDKRDAGEVLRGGLGDDTIVGGMSMFGQGGDDRLVAALVDGETLLSGGAGADTFVFSDKVAFMGWHETVVRAQHATISDFSHDEGDRIVIEHVDAATADPTFVGTVTDRSEIDVGEWGFYDGKVLVPLDYDSFEDTETPAGLEIEIVGGNITEDDVFFV